MLGTVSLFAPRQRDVDTVAAVHGGTPVSELPLEQPRHDRVALGADARAVVDEEFRSRFTLAVEKDGKEIDVCDAGRGAGEFGRERVGPVRPEHPRDANIAGKGLRHGAALVNGMKMETGERI